ncbi:MAG: hypothetical protein M1142_00915 [Patescibacteria group bacterium]|nr:hypothetical protein [Patescibacteria group bacterium]
MEKAVRLKSKYMAERADFHIHLGDRTNENLLDEAIRNHVSVLAVLDRGIIKTTQLEQLIKAGQNQGIEILPAVECLTEVPLNSHSISVEFLGLDFDLNHPAIYRNFNPKGEFYSQKHQRKVAYQVGCLENQGFQLNRVSETNSLWSTVDGGEFLDTAIRLCRIVVLDPANQKLLQSANGKVEAHLAKRPEDKPKDPNNPTELSLLNAKVIYWELFAPGMPGFKKWHLDPQTILNTIHEAGGVVIVPHPKFQHKLGGTTVEEALDHLFKIGIDGVEVWDANLIDKKFTRQVLSKGKIALGGSGQDTTYYQNRVMGMGDIKDQRMFISTRRLVDLKLYKVLHGYGRPQLYP